MRIAIDVRPLLAPVRTGVGEYTAGLTRALAAAAPQHEFILWYNAATPPTLEKLFPEWTPGSNVRVVITRWPNRMLNAALWLTGRPYLDTLVGGADVWLAPNLNFTRVLPDVRLVQTVHDLSFEVYPQFYSWKMRAWHAAVQPRKLARRAGLVITPSEYTRQEIIGRWDVPAERVQVVYPGAPEKKDFTSIKLPTQSGLQLPSRYFLCLGTIEPRKNILGTLAAFTEWRARFDPAATLVIAGASGWQDEKLYAAAQHTAGVHMLGAVTEAQKAALWQGATCVVYPSWYEGFGLPILEAFAAGVPVITSSRTSLPEVAGAAAYYVHPDKPAELVTAWQRLNFEPGFKENLVARGRARLELFSWQKSAEKMLQFLSIV